MKTILTKEGHIKLQNDLKLRNAESKVLLEALMDARDKGDLSENAEYHIAKEEYEMVQLKISKIESTLFNSIILDTNNIDTSLVSILATVKVLNIKMNKEQKFTIVPENEIDIKNGKISLNSPIAKGLLGKRINESVEIQTPGGKMGFKIIEITS